MSRLAFRIDDMDCAHEVAALKKQLGPLVGGEQNLAFDLLARTLIVNSASTTLDSEQLVAAIAGTGMKAVPLVEGCPTGVCRAPDHFRERRTSLMLCAASGVFLVAGFLVQAWHAGGIFGALFQTSPSAPRPDLASWLYAGAMVCGAWHVVPKAVAAARTLRFDMNLLMILAVAGAVGIGEWFEAASVTFLFALALLLESWSVSRARTAIQTLLQLTPTRARFYSPSDGRIEERPVEEVVLGMLVLVRPGEKIPLDGVVVKGATSVDQAPITGESMPVHKEAGDEVFAGTINLEGAIEFEATRLATETTLAKIIHMVEEAQTRRAPTEQWVDSFARYYTPMMILLSVLIAVVPPVLSDGSWSSWFYQALVVLVVACPCSLVISTPVSVVAGLTAAARHGVLIKGGAYLEIPARLKAVAFDKTGTLTRGQPTVQEVVSTGRHSREELLSRAAALEIHSTHPVARAILRHAQALGLAFDPAQDFVQLPGQGARGVVAGQLHWIGSHRMLHQMAQPDDHLHGVAVSLEDAGHSLVTLWCADHACGFISCTDEVRPEAAPAVSALKALGIRRVAMLTGDNEKTARDVAATTGVDEYRAELLPEDKVAVVRELKGLYGPVAVVGDGVNDAPAMVEATLGIAMGAMGSDAAVETADIALMSDDLSRLPWLIRHSRMSLRVIRWNIGFSLSVKVLFVGLSLLGAGTLWGAIAADMGASLLVISNGLRLLRN